MQRHTYGDENSSVHAVRHSSARPRVALGEVRPTNEVRPAGELPPAKRHVPARREQTYPQDKTNTAVVANDVEVAAGAVEPAVAVAATPTTSTATAATTTTTSTDHADAALPGSTLSDHSHHELEDSEDAPLVVPMTPKWSRAIFLELQQVQREFARDLPDPEDEDTWDVTMAAEYAPEIFEYMHSLELRMAPDPFYMDHQDELQWLMRGVLVDWIVQVHQRFNLLPETLFLTINYVDRFLSRRKVLLLRFQLVGIVALFLAAKYEEINCPLVHEVQYMVENLYTVEELLKAERFMIDVLEFEMGWPGPMLFLRRTSKADDYDYETRTLAKYFLEITIMDPRLVAAAPLWLAAGSHYLARRLLNRGAWTSGHVFYSGYTELQLRPLAQVLLEQCRNGERTHKAIFTKYSERRYRRSAAFVQEYFQAVE